MNQEIIDFIRGLYGSEGVVPLHAPVFRGNEKKYLLDSIDSTYVSSVGPYVNRLEATLAEITGARFAVATVNGTAALHIGLKLAGVEPGTEVITQALTFVATANAIAYCGARPIFCDVDADTLGLSPTAVGRFLAANAQRRSDGCYNKTSGARITACVPMHTFGHPVRLDELLAVCAAWGLPVVEDAAEALGSTYHGKAVGTFGLLGAISFNGNKIVTCGGGGVLLTNDTALARRARHLTTTAKVAHPYEYVHDAIGYNYRLPNLNAAVLCAQLEQLPALIANQRDTARQYAAFFRGLDRTNFIAEPAGARSNCWLNAVQFESQPERDAFLSASHAAGIMSRPIWRLMQRLEMYRDCQTDRLENSGRLEATVVNLPSSARMQDGN